MTRDAPASAMTGRMGSWFNTSVGLFGLCLRIDGRRPASWIAAAMTAAVGYVAALAEPSQAALIGWASGVTAAAVACGERPPGRWRPVAGRTSRLGGPAGFERVQALERLAWPLAGAVGGWLVIGGCGMTPSTDAATAFVTSAAGVVMAGLLLLMIEAAGGAGPDAIALVLILAVLTGATAGHAVWMLAVGWALASCSAVALVCRVDRRASLAREAWVAGVPPGSSELRRWILRGLMVGMLVAMIRWLLVTEPCMAWYGVIGMLASASLILPESLRRGGVTEVQMAVAPSQRSTRWRPLALQAMPAVIALWPLVVAALVAPSCRGGAAVVAGLGLIFVPAVAVPSRAALKRRWIGRETAFSAGVVLVGMAAVAIGVWGSRQIGKASAVFPWDS